MQRGGQHTLSVEAASLLLPLFRHHRKLLYLCGAALHPQPEEVSDQCFHRKEFPGGDGMVPQGEGL